MTSPAPNAPDPVAALRDKFSISETPKSWLLVCLHCGKRASLVKSRKRGRVHPGSVWVLLNHAAGHRRPV